MKAILAMLVAMIVGLSVNLRAEPLAQQVGEILVPPPKGMVDVSDYSDHFRKVVNLPQQKPFGLYYLVNEFKNLDDGSLRSASQSAQGKVRRVFTTESSAKLEFYKDMKVFEAELGKIKYSSEEVQKSINDASKNAAVKFPNIKIDINGTAVLDTAFSQATRFTIVQLLNGKTTVDGETIDSQVLYCNGFQLIGKTYLNLIFGMPMKDGSSPTVAKAALVEWMDAIAKKNTK
ncbi:MAG: hypothetical protein WCP45_06715 [Verrucomicrobiota bacterium]